MRRVLWFLGALAGVVLAAGVSYAASSLSTQRVGLSAEPPSAGAELAPRATPKPRPRRTATPKPRRTPKPRATPRPAPTTVPVPTAAPTVDDHGGGGGGGGDSGGGGRGRDHPEDD
jgi:hypothetical protein